MTITLSQKENQKIIKEILQPERAVQIIQKISKEEKNVAYKNFIDQVIMKSNSKITKLGYIEILTVKKR